ncbi:MAG: mannose-1-phosphate guanylyltransferase/mannose-6-phosphate isomerase [Desulfobacteraceae bacterium]|nr:MAG: mannose-1-phosphate guanylyltransferase/mannose-6-phosphate isomerase [Desulfobacteraceae bacterium]
MIIPVILAGGSGTRLWPLSRQLFPKQMIAITDEFTMLQNTVKRLQGADNLLDPMVICNEEHRFMAAEQLRQIEVTPHTIILEPVGKNTAPAIALAACKALENDDDPVLLVLPADHVIENQENFHQAIQEGMTFALQDYLITFGILPNAPETGYGYIKKGEALDSTLDVSRIERFVEKPDRDTAQQYLDSQAYCWNSGMFMFKASVIVNELEKQAPEVVSICRAAIEAGTQDLDFFRISKDLFSKVPSDSIDYAVMEKTEQGVMIGFDAGWNDLGSWEALWQTGDKDRNANVIKGDVIVHDVQGSYLNAQERLIAAVGLEDVVVVETSDAVLVSPKDRVQDVKKIVETIKTEDRSEAVNHRRVYRPWGDYETIDISNRYQVKRITVKPQAKLSLQKHYHRAEHWTVVSGSALVTKDDATILLKEDESTYIPIGVKHRLENPGKIPLELIEVQSGSYLGEDDIVRYEDVYGRKEG